MSGDVTLDPETLERLREDAERLSPGALSGVCVARHELLALLSELEMRLGRGRAALLPRRREHASRKRLPPPATRSLR